MGKLEPTNYVEVCVRGRVDSGELLAMLDDDWFIGAWEDDDAIYLYWPSDRWDGQARRALVEALRRMGDPTGESAIETKVIPEQDWNARWTSSIRPIRVGRRILIRQSWNPADPPPDGFALTLDPKQAFGTGYHATTQLLLEWLEQRIFGGERILDVGTGSGILAMAALRLGAGSALGIDHDAVAIECARDYAAVNGFRAELELRTAALQDVGREQFDVVLANLDFTTLIADPDALLKHVAPQGAILISGLRVEDYKEIAAAFEIAGGIVRARNERDQWLALEIGVADRARG